MNLVVSNGEARNALAFPQCDKIEDDRLMVLILRVGHRKEIYR